MSVPQTWAACLSVHENNQNPGWIGCAQSERVEFRHDGL